MEMPNYACIANESDAVFEVVNIVMWVVCWKWLHFSNSITIDIKRIILNTQFTNSLKAMLKNNRNIEFRITVKIINKFNNFACVLMLFVLCYFFWNVSNLQSSETINIIAQCWLRYSHTRYL